MSIDETRLDLRAADQERLERWRQEARETTRQVQEVMRMGVGMYPIVGRRGTVYGTPRRPPVEAGGAMDRDQETKMPEQDRVERPTYEQALDAAIKYATEAGANAGSVREDMRERAVAWANASRAWSAIAGLLRADEVRVDTAAYMDRLREMGLSPTGRKRDYVRVPAVKNDVPAPDSSDAMAAVLREEERD